MKPLNVKNDIYAISTLKSDAIDVVARNEFQFSARKLDVQGDRKRDRSGLREYIAGTCTKGLDMMS